MLESFLAGSDELEVVNEETLVAVTVLVINVEFNVGVKIEDGVITVVLFTGDTNTELLTGIVVFLDKITVELFTGTDFVSLMEEGEKDITELVTLMTTEDLISVLLGN